MAELEGSDGFFLSRRVEVLRLSVCVASFLARQGLDFFGQVEPSGKSTLSYNGGKRCAEG